MRMPIGKVFRLGVACAAALALALPAQGAGKGGRRGEHAHPHHRPANPSLAAFFFASPLLLFGSPPAGYSGYIPRTYPGFGPVLYIERYDGPPPQAGTTEWLYCPAREDSWPQVRQCPGGWARVVEHPEEPDFEAPGLEAPEG